MRTVILAFLVCFSITAPARETVTDPDLIAEVQESVRQFLEFDDSEIAGGLLGDISEVFVTALGDSPDGQSILLTVESAAYYYSTDYDFGDPVDELDVNCQTTVEWSDAGYKALQTTCDFDPNKRRDQESEVEQP